MGRIQKFTFKPALFMLVAFIIAQGAVRVQGDDKINCYVCTLEDAAATDEETTTEEGSTEETTEEDTTTTRKAVAPVRFKREAPEAKLCPAATTKTKDCEEATIKTCMLTKNAWGCGKAGASCKDDAKDCCTGNECNRVKASKDGNSTSPAGPVGPPKGGSTGSGAKGASTRLTAGLLPIILAIVVYIFNAY